MTGPMQPPFPEHPRPWFSGRQIGQHPQKRARAGAGAAQCSRPSDPTVHAGGPVSGRRILAPEKASPMGAPFAQIAHTPAHPKR